MGKKIVFILFYNACTYVYIPSNFFFIKLISPQSFYFGFD